MNTIETTVKLQDYFLDLETEKTHEPTYELVLENNTDFIINRKTLKTERELVILISKGLYYIKDKKNETIEKVTLSSIKSFLRNLKRGIELKQVHWLSMLDKDSAETIDRIISNEIYTDMCRHNVLSGMDDIQWHSVYWKKNSKLFMQLYSMFPTINDSRKFKVSFPLIFELNNKFGYNEAIYFANQLVQSGIEGFFAATNFNFGHRNELSHSCAGFMEILENTQYNLQLRRFTDFLFFDLFAQGIQEIGSSFWHDYNDYLQMQIQFYGKIQEKYPNHFKTEHDIITLKINQMKMIEERESFEKLIKEIESLSYQCGKYCIVIPRKLEDIAEEGISLSHCVKSYISKVVNSECHILFLRSAQNPEQSLVTVQLTKNCVCQARGQSNREIKEEERAFLLHWGAEKGINIAV